MRLVLSPARSYFNVSFPRPVLRGYVITVYLLSPLMTNGFWAAETLCISFSVVQLVPCRVKDPSRHLYSAELLPPNPGLAGTSERDLLGK